MTRDDIIRMAVQCQLVNAGNREGLYMDALAEFAELVAATEREECAKMCEQISDEEYYMGRQYADMLRARGQV